MHILNNYSNSVYPEQLENFEKIEGFSTFVLIKPQPLSLLQYSAKEQEFCSPMSPNDMGAILGAGNIKYLM